MKTRLPCPFCGNREVVVYTDSEAETGYCQCAGCSADGPVRKDRDSAIEAWNIRTESQQVADLTAKLEAANESVTRHCKLNHQVVGELAAVTKERDEVRGKLEAAEKDNREIAQILGMKDGVN